MNNKVYSAASNQAKLTHPMATLGVNYCNVTGLNVSTMHQEGLEMDLGPLPSCNQLMRGNLWVVVVKFCASLRALLHVLEFLLSLGCLYGENLNIKIGSIKDSRWQFYVNMFCHLDRGSIDNFREVSTPSPFHPRPSPSFNDLQDAAAGGATDGGMDNPEMVEVRKKRKDLMEQGLLKWVLVPTCRVSVVHSAG